jgi:hypothetical protein
VTPARDKPVPSKLDGILKNLSIKVAKTDRPEPQLSTVEINSLRSLVRHPFLHFHKAIELTLRSGETIALAFNGEQERERVVTLLLLNSGTLV